MGRLAMGAMAERALLAATLCECCCYLFKKHFDVILSAIKDVTAVIFVPAM